MLVMCASDKTTVDMKAQSPIEFQIAPDRLSRDRQTDSGERTGWTAIENRQRSSPVRTVNKDSSTRSVFLTLWNMAM